MAEFKTRLYNKLAAGILKLLKLSIRFEVNNQPDKSRVLYAFWHRDLMLCMLQRAGDSVAVMVSASRDGELLAGPMGELGYTLIRGSSSKHGSQALKAMLRMAREKSLAITPDGPRGPSGTIHPGLWQIAIVARIPIVAVRCDSNREWVFNSWDRFRLPKPFARVRVVYSDPIYLLSQEDIPTAEQRFRDFLDEVRLGR